MAKRRLAPPSNRLFRETEMCKVIRECEPLLIEVLNEEREFVKVDNNTREVPDADVEQAFARVCDTANIFNLVFRNGYMNGRHLRVRLRSFDQQYSSCMYCTTYKRMLRPDQIKRGYTIRFPKIWGSYYHYAIVTKVQEGSTSRCCTLTLVHLQKVSKPLQTRLIEETKTYNLRKETVEKVIYKLNPFTSDQVAQRAEKCAAQDKTESFYNLFGNNCEHLSNRFSQGIHISHQVHRRLDQLQSGYFWIFNVLFKIGSIILEQPEISEMAPIIPLLNTIRKIVDLEMCREDGRVCSCCYQKEYEKLKVSLVEDVISLAVNVLWYSCGPTLTIGIIIGIAFPIVVPYVHQHIMSLIHPSFLIPKGKLSINNIPKAGDIITFVYNSLSHEGVVSTVHGIRSDIASLNATIIHFPWPGLFGTYTVTEETICFTKIDDISVLNFEGTHRLPASDVVKKAKEQLGKQNHSHFTYRSSHLSRYCKTGRKNIRTLPKVQVRSMDNLSPGDVIRFRYCGLPHEAVLVEIAEAEDITLNVIHYNYAGMFETREVVNETMTFKLLDENVLIHDYANVEVYEPKEVVRRAKSRVGEKKFNMLTNRSSHLAKSCKVKEK